MIARTLGNRRLWLAAVVVLLVVAGYVVHMASSVEAPDADTVPPRTPGDQEAIAAAATRIAEESGGTLPPPEVVAAPIARGVPARPSESARRSPAPPPGYSFVEHFGEMPKAGMAYRNAGGSDAADSPAWFNSANAVYDLTRQAAAAGRDWTFGWVWLAEDARSADLARALDGTGGEVVGASGRMVRVRFPGDPTRLEAIEALHAVDGIGTAPPQAKLAGFADESLADAPGRTPVYVTLMTDDADGRWRREMQDIGAVVGGYDPALRIYEAVAEQAVIDALADADFVQAVEPVRVVKSAHDTAVPAMGADALRTYDGSPGLFAGTTGSSVPIGVMDTGLNINHLDIASHRESICGANFVDWDQLVEDEDLWIDANAHGTHVTGTVAGNGYVERRFAGMAPGVRHIRFAKVLDRWGGGLRLRSGAVWISSRRNPAAERPSR